MKMSKFKLAFIALCVATVVLGTAFYYTRLEYAHARPGKPYLDWRRGFYVIVTGEFLILAWGVFFGKLFTRKVFPRLKRLMDKKKITALALMIFGLCITSSFPIGLAFIQEDPRIRVNVLLVCDDAFERVVYHMGALRWVPATQLVYENRIGSTPFFIFCKTLVV